jgi:hypothetical protein
VRPEIRELQAALEEEGYIAEPAIATGLFLARDMQKPLLVEGDAGVGKTELAKVLARLLGTELIRLQCYEGLDVQTALYEWDYPRQLLRLRMSETRGEDPRDLETRIFSRDYLLERPLLRAITRTGKPPVLLIDEIDRADDGFEAFLLELLSDFQVTIPELGTIRAEHPPHVLLTSNRTRELGDALRRRCLYLYIEHPSFGFLMRLSREDVVAAQASGAPGFAYEEPLLWLSPVSEDATILNAYGVFRPDPLTGDLDDPQMERYGGLAPEFHPAIVNYGLWKAGEYTHHEASALGEKWRLSYEGKDGTEGDIAKIKRILAKRVTPQASRRRDLTGNLGSLGVIGDYIGA